jgi:signal transduction histidine kinase
MFKLKLAFLAFFFAVLLPCTYLLMRSYNHLETETLLASKEKATFVSQIINQTIDSELSTENLRSFAEYRFIMSVSVIGGEEVTLSPLAQLPDSKSSLVGYFQIDPDLSLHTPILPEGALAELDLIDKRQRIQLKNQLESLLNGMDLSNLGVVERVNTRAIEGALNIKESKIKDPRLQKLLKKTNPRYEALTQKRDLVFNAEGSNDSKTKQRPNPTDSNGYSEVAIHPLQCTIHNSQIVFYRLVMRGGERYIQGFVHNMQEYFKKILNEDVGLNSYTLIDGIQLSQNLKKGGTKPLLHFGRTPKMSEVILKQSLSPPLQDLSLSFRKNIQTKPPGSSIIWSLGVLLGLLLSGGLIASYKIIKNNVDISQSRSDFISAVSHELKTPLTAIRMYAEMLEAGFVVGDEKKAQYYKKISSESNRLSRLIQNVLDLSNVERNQWVGDIQSYQLEDLLEQYERTYSQNISNRGFKLDMQLHSGETSHLLDRDAFMQILVNIVENSIKFSKESPKKHIIIESKRQAEFTMLTLRDHGPGVPSSELQQIFTSFYRIEKEMVRKTTGTGIGLSLVHKLCHEMNIRVEAKNVHPGLTIVMQIPIEQI